MHGIVKAEKITSYKYILLAQIKQNVNSLENVVNAIAVLSDCYILIESIFFSIFCRLYCGK